MQGELGEPGKWSWGNQGEPPPGARTLTMTVRTLLALNKLDQGNNVRISPTSAATSDWRASSPTAAAGRFRDHPTIKGGHHQCTLCIYDNLIPSSENVHFSIYVSCAPVHQLPGQAWPGEAMLHGGWWVISIACHIGSQPVAWQPTQQPGCYAGGSQGPEMTPWPRILGPGPRAPDPKQQAPSPGADDG